MAAPSRGISARPIDSLCGFGAPCARRYDSLLGVPDRSDSPPNTLAAAPAIIAAQREALLVAEARAVAAEARASAAESEARSRALLIEKLTYTIRKLRHEKFGQSSERGALLEQLELQLADLEADAAEAEASAGMAATNDAGGKSKVASFERRRPARRPFPAHLPRERIVYPSPTTRAVAAAACGKSERT